VQDRLIQLLPRLHGFARALTGSTDAADDLVQEACERALVRSRETEGILRLDSWLFRIIHNAWIDEKRRCRSRLSDPIEAGMDIVGEDGEQTVGLRSALSQVRREMAHLPEEQRTVLLLVCVQGLSYQEAADILDIPVGTVMSRLSRGRLGLAERLRGTEADSRKILRSSATPAR
jgi:RNA polymerase sigma-70 factor (ECF subfamily)